MGVGILIPQLHVPHFYSESTPHRAIRSITHYVCLSSATPCMEYLQHAHARNAGT